MTSTLASRNPFRDAVILTPQSTGVIGVLNSPTPTPTTATINSPPTSPARTMEEVGKPAASASSEPAADGEHRTAVIPGERLSAEERRIPPLDGAATPSNTDTATSTSNTNTTSPTTTTNTTSPTSTNDGATPASNDSPSGSTTGHSSNPRPLDDRFDEEPPAYTPNADHGESTVEYGPLRPFQAIRHRPSPPRLTPPQPVPGPSSAASRPSRSGSLWRQFEGALNEIANVTNDAIHRLDRLSHTNSKYTNVPVANGRPSGGWTSHPGTSAHPPHQPVYPHATGHPPPPQHPALHPQVTGGPSHQPHPAPAGPPSSDSKAPSLPPLPALTIPQTSSASISSPSRTNRSTPEAASATTEFARDFYAAGTGVPRTSVDGRPVDADGVSTNGSINSNSSSGRAANPPSGVPTYRPTPGHPLLREGKLLVYPPGFECSTCHNVGYKLPGLKPCKTCWQKHAKPFSGPLAYSFGLPEAPFPADCLQRPLPFPPAATPQRSGAGYPGQYAPQMSMNQMYHQPPPNAMVSSPYSMGPAHGNVVVMQAGDPRLGGRLCLRCEGRGTISIFVIDREQCTACGGMGRIFD